MKQSEIFMDLGIASITDVDSRSIKLQQGHSSVHEDWHPKKQLIQTPQGTCIRSGHLLFIGGIEGWDPVREDEPGDIQVQIRRVLTIIKGILEGAGSSMANVLKVQMSIADPNKNISALNEVYREFFPDTPPVRSFSGAKSGQMGRDGLLCQVSCMAYVD